MKPLEQQLRTEDLNLHISLLNDLAAVSATDANGIITFVNDRFCKESGYSREELIGQNHRMLKSGRHKLEFYKQLWKTLQAGRTWQGTFCNRRRDGQDYWVKSTITPFLNERGEIYQFVSIRSNITDQVRATALAKSVTERIEHIVSQVNAGILVISSDQRITMTNRYLLDLLGQTQDTLTGDLLENQTQFNLVAELLPYYKQHLREPLKRIAPVVQLISAGKQLAAELSFNSVLNAEQDLDYTLITITNITKIHQQSHQLRINQQRFDLSQQIARNGTWELDLRTNELFWSAGVAPLFGYQPGQLDTSYENFINSVHPDDRETVAKAIQQSLEKSVHYYVEHRVVWPNGEIHWLLETGNVERDSNGQPVSMLGVVQLIDNRKRMQNSLVRQRDINAMLRIATLKLLNPAVKKDQVIQEMMAHLATHLQAEYAFFRCHHNNSDGQSSDIRPVWVTVDGDRLLDARRIPIPAKRQNRFASWCFDQQEAITIRDFSPDSTLPATLLSLDWRNLYFFPVVFASTPLGYFGLVNISLDNQSEIEESINQFRGTLTALLEYLRLRDLEQQSRRQLMQAMQVAEKANNAKTEFLASVSHELRTPLNAILGFTELLQISEHFSDDDMRNLLQIQQSGEHLLSLINEMLDLMQIESGKLEMHYETLDLADIVDSCIAVNQSLADKHQVTIDRAAFVYQVHADPRRLRQVLINLINNAIKYNRQQGYVFIRARQDGNQEIRLDVEDSGTGIEADDIDKVFEPFERLQHRKSSIQGSGIGLNVTRNLIQQMGGRIELQSQPGIGSVFTIWIPLQTRVPGRLQKQQSLQSLAETKTQQGEIDPDLKILIAEDNSFNRDLVSRQLQKLGLQHIVLASDGSEAFRLWQETAPDIVLTDINMPDMDGFDLLKAIRSAGESETAGSIIAMTANVMPEEKQKIIEAGFDGYISKPISLQSLRSSLVQFSNVITSEQPEIVSRVFDPEILRGYVGDDDNTEKLLLNTFLETGASTLEQVGNALDAGELTKAGKLAHRLKSSVRTIGYDKLTRAVEALEKQALAGSETAARSAYQTAGEHMQNLEAEIRAYLDRS